MGTRGAWIERRNGEDTIYYRQFDSYPDGWPSDMVKRIGDTAAALAANRSAGPVAYRGSSGTTMVVATDGFRLLEGDDGPGWLADSLFCEWAYCLNHDEGTLEVYEGFQESAHDCGRYANLPPDDSGYAPVKLVATFAVDDIPQDWCQRVSPVEDDDE